MERNPVTGGQLLGIGTLIAISLVGSLIGLLIEQRYIGLLGLIPIFLGMKGVLSLVRNSVNNESDAPRTAGGRSKLFTVAGVTVANGGDNIGIYIPLFAMFGWPDKIAMIVIFFAMTLVWCFAAKYFVKHPYVAQAVGKYGHILTPFVLVVLGLYILYENGTFGLLMLV